MSSAALRVVDGGAAMTTLDRWQQWMAAAGHAPATIGVRTRSIQALVRHANVNDITELDRDHCIAFLSRPLARWTRVSYYRSVRQLSAFLREYGIDPDSDLTRGLPRPATPRPMARPIDDETVTRLLAAELSPRAHAYVRLAVLAGLRVHEVAKVRGEDLQDGWLRVTGKGDFTASIPIHVEIQRIAESMPSFGPWFPSWLNPSQPVSPRAVTETVKNALRSVGSTATPHMLRDTFATRVQRTVRDVRVTQSLLRHRSIRSTQKYIAVADRDMQAGIASLDWHHAA